MSKREPKLRNVNKVKAPFKLNHFPKHFTKKLGEELVYVLSTKKPASITGNEWEQIFANCIGAEWKPSNVGLDDVILGNTAWGAKTVKAAKPASVKKVRLISGRNSPHYSYGEDVSSKTDPEKMGEMVLEIWNARVSSIRAKYENLRTVVLVKGDGLREVLVFEFDTVRYDFKDYDWLWNKKKNLEGWSKARGLKTFIWQPHGSQFTITENIPTKNLLVKIVKEPKLSKQFVLDEVGYDESWIEIEERN